MQSGKISTRCFCFKYDCSLSCSCWLSLEGGLLYAFVGPAAVIVLVSVSVITGTSFLL